MASTSTPSALPEHLLQLATLQLVTQAAPFTHCRTLPLHTLTDLVADYLQLLAKAAKDSAELAGRDKVSVWDLGNALGEFGVGGLADLRDELDKGNGASEEAERIRDLAGGLKELLDPPPIPDPAYRLTYDALLPQEILALNEVYALSPPKEEESDSGSSDDEPELKSPEPLSPAAVRIKPEEPQFNLVAFDGLVGGDEVVIQPMSAWRDPTLIPAYVHEFLPPFPGMERESDVPDNVRRRREREKEREAAAEAWAGANGTTSSDPWVGAIPYSSSTIAEINAVPVLPPVSPPPSPSARKRRRSLSPPSATSLAFFKIASSEIASVPTWSRVNPKRRAAAAAISISSDLSLSNDSLFGNIPVPTFRSASLVPGFLTDNALNAVHPFSTNLPHTIATPVPARPSPHARLMAPPTHPRVPTIIGSIASQLAQPATPQNLQLFSRLTRMGPPGPLGAQGEANYYEYVGNTNIIATNVEWPQRSHRDRLPKIGKEGEEGAGETGIKLNLRIGRSDSASNLGSPAPPGTTWGGFIAGDPGATPIDPAATPAATPGGGWGSYGGPDYLLNGGAEASGSGARDLQLGPFDPYSYATPGTGIDTPQLSLDLDAVLKESYIPIPTPNTEATLPEMLAQLEQLVTPQVDGQQFDFQSISAPPPLLNDYEMAPPPAPSTSSQPPPTSTVEAPISISEVAPAEPIPSSVDQTTTLVEPQASGSAPVEATPAPAPDSAPVQIPPAPAPDSTPAPSVEPASAPEATRLIDPSLDPSLDPSRDPSLSAPPESMPAPAPTPAPAVDPSLDPSLGVADPPTTTAVDPSLMSPSTEAAPPSMS
ncbi:Bromodomain transcription factor [Pseudohyphozyma bogoriensis]|nr:Bromodomain transcription factor [Pseudohyphozyma bogoriensis]